MAVTATLVGLILRQPGKSDSPWEINLVNVFGYMTLFMWLHLAIFMAMLLLLSSAGWWVKCNLGVHMISIFLIGWVIWKVFKVLTERPFSVDAMKP